MRTTAEIHFAIGAKNPDTSSRLVLRVTKAGGAVLGVKDGDRGPFRPTGEPVPFPSPDWFEEHSRYVEVRFLLAGGVWRASFNGVEAGHVADDGSPKAAEMRLYAENGRLRVGTVELEHLEAKAE